MDVVKACVDKAGALQMKACLYDEDRWPSGACGGAVTKDPEFRSRYLVFTPFSKEEGTGRKESERRASLPERVRSLPGIR